MMRGDVVLTYVPNVGAPGGKLRPAVIVQTDQNNARLQETIIAAVTSNLSNVRQAHQFLIETASADGRATGLLHDSAVRCERLHTIPQTEIRRTIGRLSPALIKLLDQVTEGIARNPVVAGHPRRCQLHRLDAARMMGTLGRSSRGNTMRKSTIGSALAIGFVLQALVFAADEKSQRPNILFIFSDDHAYQAIGAYGSKINQTPHIDRLAREGMRFDRCYVTNSICGPSRAVIQTGKYSHLNGFYRNGNRFNGDQQTFPKLLKTVGYQTAVIGKWHLETAPQGFDYSEILIGQGPYYNPTMIKNGQNVKHTGYTTEIIADLALDWLKNGRDQSKPFMLMCQNKAPHREWEPGPKYFDRYENEKIPEPATLFDDYANRASPARKQDMTIAKTMTPRDLKLVTPAGLNAEQKAAWEAVYGPRNEAFQKANLQGDDLVRWKYQRYMKDYLRCIAAVDDSVGRLLKYLDDAGLASNTVVMYASDQGFYLGEHGWFDKRWMYEESLRTPFLVRWPGVTKPGSVNADIVSNVDFAETFLEIAGVEVPSDMQGRSLKPVLAGKTPSDWRKSFYYHYYEFPGPHSVAKHYGVTNGRYKLINYYELGEWELFDLEQDPHEIRSVHGQAAYATTQKEMEGELSRLRRQLQVPEKDAPDSFAPMPRKAAN